MKHKEIMNLEVRVNKQQFENFRLYAKQHKIGYTIKGDDTTDFWDTLSDWEKQDIEAGIKDLDEGRKKSFDEVIKKYL